MNLIKPILLIVAVVVMVACKRTSLDKLVIPKPDTGKIIKADTNTFILIKDEDTYNIKKGYITFKTPDTTITITSPTDSITFFKWSDDFGIYGRSGPLNIQSHLSIESDSTASILVNSVYNLRSFTFSHYEINHNSWGNGKNLKITFTQYNKPPILAKGTFTGLVEKTDKNNYRTNELIQGEFYLELTKK